MAWLCHFVPPHIQFSLTGNNLLSLLLLLVWMFLFSSCCWCCCCCLCGAAVFFRKAHFGLSFFWCLTCVSLNVLCVSLVVMVPSEGERHHFCFTAFALITGFSALPSSHASYNTRHLPFYSYAFLSLTNPISFSLLLLLSHSNSPKKLPPPSYSLPSSSSKQHSHRQQRLHMLLRVQQRPMPPIRRTSDRLQRRSHGLLRLTQLL